MSKTRSNSPSVMSTTGAAHAGDIPHHVDPAVVVGGAGDERVHVGPAAHVHFDADRCPTPTIDLLDRRFNAGAVDVAQHDGGSRPGQHEGRGPAYPAGRAGQHRHPVGQVEGLARGYVVGQWMQAAPHVCAPVGL